MNTKISLLKACTLYSFYSPGDVSDDVVGSCPIHVNKKSERS